MILLIVLPAAITPFPYTHVGLWSYEKPVHRESRKRLMFLAQSLVSYSSLLVEACSCGNSFVCSSQDSCMPFFTVACILICSINGITIQICCLRIHIKVTITNGFRKEMLYCILQFQSYIVRCPTTEADKGFSSPLFLACAQIPLLLLEVARV